MRCIRDSGDSSNSSSGSTRISGGYGGNVHQKKPFIARTSGSFGSSDVHAICSPEGQKAQCYDSFPSFFSTCPSAHPLFSQRAKRTHAVAFKLRSRNFRAWEAAHCIICSYKIVARARRGPRAASSLTLSRLRSHVRLNNVDLYFYDDDNPRQAGIHLLFADILYKIMT